MSVLETTLYCKALKEKEYFFGVYTNAKNKLTILYYCYVKLLFGYVNDEKYFLKPF